MHSRAGTKGTEVWKKEREIRDESVGREARRLVGRETEGADKGSTSGGNEAEGSLVRIREKKVQAQSESDEQVPVMKEEMRAS